MQLESNEEQTSNPAEIEKDSQIQMNFDQPETTDVAETNSETETSQTS